MEDSHLEPLANEIPIRSNAKPAKGLWSSRSAGAAKKTADPTPSVIWEQGLKETGKSKQVYSLLAEFRTANEEGRFVQAMGAYREAAHLSRADKELKDAAIEHGLKEIKTLAVNNWRVATALWREVSALDPARTLAPAVSSELERCERSETIANALAEIKPGGDSEQAYVRLTRAIRMYPADASLEGHLAEVSAAVVRKRGATERKKRLAIVAAFQADVESGICVEDVEKSAALSELALGPYRCDAAVLEIFNKIQEQARSCRMAATALAAGHVAACLQECSRGLVDSPRQRFLSDLRRQAREFVYSSAEDAIAQITDLLENGPLLEAQEAFKSVQAQFAGSAEIPNLDAAVRDKDATLRRLLAGAEESLLKRDVEAAGLAFLEAQRLLPQDAELSAHTAALLHTHARTEIDHDWRAFESTLHLLSRIRSSLPLPADIAAVVQRRKDHAEAIRLQAEAIHAIAERGLQADVLRDAGSVAAKPQGKVKVAESVQEPVRVAVQPAVVEIDPAPLFQWRDKTTIGVLAAVAATLLCAMLLAWHDHQMQNASKAKAAVAAAAPLKPQMTLSAAVEPGRAAAEAAEAPPAKMATLEIRGAEPGTEVRVDNVLLGAAVLGNSLTRELSSGDHVVQLSREGSNPKRMALHFAPGEVALLTGSNVELQPTDAAVQSAERRDWNVVKQEHTIAGLQEFLQKYPSGEHASEAKSDLREQLWQNVDKSDADALLAFAGKYPDTPVSAKARELAQSVNRQNALRAEQSDWVNVNKSSKQSVMSFLMKYPNGPHASAASSMIADLDRQQVAASMQAQDGKSLSTLARADVPRREEYKPPAPDPSLAESAAVLDVIGRFANAWNTKDYQSLVEIEPDLNRRSLKAQLSPVKAVNMRISPVAPPQISGTQATVMCRRQADETFSDGSLKQNPEAIVTYVLAKRNGAWGIQAIR